MNMVISGFQNHCELTQVAVDSVILPSPRTY